MQQQQQGTRRSMGDTTPRRRGALGLCVGIATLFGAACSAEDGAGTLGTERLATQPAPNIDARRSLAITDQPVLVNFTLKRVLDQIIATSGVPGLTATALFEEWWDTQNPAPGLGVGPHCDDTLYGDLPALNGYPYGCRPAPAEGFQASCDPFAAGSACAYIPVGLFMRFDLAPEDGRHCGEYRVIFAKDSGRSDAQNRNLLIFEAALRNPHVNQGIRGCEKYVRAWADLSNQPDLNKRRATLEGFYFDGWQEFDPIISYTSFGENPLGAGQVRTNSFVQPNTPRVWSLREFKLKRPCTPGCSLEFVPVSDKVNPFGPLFDAASTNANAPGFQAEFLTQVPRLAATDPNGIAMNPSEAYDSGQSQASSTVTETNYPFNFGTGPSAFRTAIQATLTNLGSTLTPDDVVARAQVTACAGCHRFSNNANLGNSVTWPPSLGFTHVSERDVDVENVGGVSRYLISDALVNLLLPHRKQVAEDFLNNVPHPAKPPGDPIGGRWVH
jgi:hypothetical protein